VGLAGVKKGIKVGGRNRIPDAVTDNALIEVKNVKSLSFTKQLRDYSAYSQQHGLDFVLYVRSNTKLSSPLSKAVDNGSIILKYIPGR